MLVNELYEKLVKIILQGDGDAVVKKELGDNWISVYDLEIQEFIEDEKIKLLILR